MKILIAAPEAIPYVKTGGLADVTGALLKEFRMEDREVSLVLPLYRSIKKKFRPRKTGKVFRIKLGEAFLDGEICTSEEHNGASIYFIDCEKLYGRSELYGTPAGDYPDNALRFAFFSMAVLELCLAMDLSPDIIHCHDWQTALCPLYLRTLYRDKINFKKTATLFTIHNLGYQGTFHPSAMHFTNLGREYFTPERLEFYGKLNFMKAGIIYADMLNTVSRTYAREILTPENGFGLDGLLRTREEDLYGVINGLDYREWDPWTDDHIPSRYGLEDLTGKIECKRSLIKETGLKDKKKPLLGMVGRLSSQKGLDLVAESIGEIISCGANIVILGKGDEHYENLFGSISDNNKGRVFVKIGFSEGFSRMVYAGSDFFLMPSKYEPCGLGQLIALRYGAVPVVRKTGGLADTVRDYNHMSAEGTGFFFTDFSPDALQNSIKRALCVYVESKRMNKLTADVMSENFSWRKSAESYLELYEKAKRRITG
jgi:starch synthase